MAKGQEHKTKGFLYPMRVSFEGIKMKASRTACAA